jgi:hypothetical protein
MGIKIIYEKRVIKIIKGKKIKEKKGNLKSILEGTR